MRTKAKIKGKVAIVLSLALVGSMLLPIRIGTKTAQAAEVPTVREVNLNNNGTIPGITNPNQPGASTDAWSGSYVYLGKYWQDSDTNGDGKVDTSDEKSAIKWRVLSTENDSNGDNNGDSLLLMSDKVLDRVVFSEDGETLWEGSNIREWLNSREYQDNPRYSYTPGGFLNTAFSPTEQAAIKSTTKPEGSSLDYTQEDENISFLSSALTGDKIFLPSAEELDTAAYGFYHYGCWSYDGCISTAVAYTNFSRRLGVGYYLNQDLNVISTNYWLRSACELRWSNEGTERRCGVCSKDYYFDCVSTDMPETSIGVAPALNLDTSSILFTSKSNVDKAKTFQRTGSGSNVDAWKLTLQDGEDFSANRIEGETGSVSPGGTIHVKVTNVPTLTTGNAYTQISVMLVDDTGTVMAYGKVADYDRETGITIEGSPVTADVIPVEIPADISEGEYTLKIFAEDVNSKGTDNAVDFASNMAELEVTIENAIPQPKIQNVNFGVTGIQNPGQPDSIYEDWGGGSGNYVYFGSYWQKDTNGDGIADVSDDKEPIRWKVLSTENDSTGGNQPDSLLLYSDKILDYMVFNYFDNINCNAEGHYYKIINGELSQYDANDYSYSDVRAWLNSCDFDNSGNYTSNGFLENAFDEKERRVIKDTEKAQGENVEAVFFSGEEEVTSSAIEQDKIFLLSPAEIASSDYGFFYKMISLWDIFTGNEITFNETMTSDATEFALKNGTFTHLGEYTMLLRGGSEADTQYSACIFNGFGINRYGIRGGLGDGSVPGVAPALNLDRDAILFISAEGTNHTENFGTTEKNRYNDTWTLVLKDGTGFVAERKVGDTSSVAPGGSVTITVTSLASGNVRPYTQMSAMLVDSNGTTVAYGKISENIATGDVTVTLPEGISPGAYSLKVFEESVSGTGNVESQSFGAARNMTATTAEEASMEVNSLRVFEGSGSGKKNMEGYASDMVSIELIVETEGSGEPSKNTEDTGQSGSNSKTADNSGQTEDAEPQEKKTSPKTGEEGFFGKILFDKWFKKY